MNCRYRLPVFLLLLVSATVVILPSAPMFHSLPHRDAGVFLYVGQQILQGRLPYRDVWDHKGPALYYLNALGLALSGGSEWGVWTLQLVLVCAAAYLGFLALESIVGPRIAALSSVSWLACLSVWWSYGNRVEGFALPFHFAVLYVLLVRREPVRAWVIGICCSGCLALRPDLVVFPLTVALYLLGSAVLARRWREAMGRALGMALGSALVLGPIMAGFALQGALADLIDQVFTYNLVYMASHPANRAAVVGQSTQLIFRLGIATLPLAWVLAIVRELSETRAQLPGGLRFVGLVGFPLTLLQSSASGMGYMHYFMALLPPYHVLLCVLLWTVDVTVGAIRPRRFLSPRLLRHIAAIAIVLVSIVPVARYLRLALDTHLRDTAWPEAHPAVRYVRERVPVGETVLVWGAESGVNFASGYRSPTRYVYQYPLLTRGYQTSAKVDEFYADIAGSKPYVIIDTSSTNGAIPPLDRSERADWSANRAWFELPSEMDRVFAYIEAYYQRVLVLTPPGWAVYTRIDAERDG
ncbi:MAG: glycosyltransferase family 39 protein [Anaerolineae bacterium]|nr:glycosyltransferase family 39 protein [Anaerolineae bacterium]